MYRHDADDLFTACCIDEQKTKRKFEPLMDYLIDRILSGDDFKISTFMEEVENKSESKTEAILGAWLIAQVYMKTHERLHQDTRRIRRQAKFYLMLKYFGFMALSATLFILALYWFTPWLR